MESILQEKSKIFVLQINKVCNEIKRILISSIKKSEAQPIVAI